MKQLSKEQIRTFYALTKNNSFNLFMIWFKESLDEEREVSDGYRDIYDTRVSQGVRQNLNAIIETVNELETQIKEIEN